MSLDRKTAPVLRGIEDVPFGMPESTELSGGNKLFYYNDSDLEVVKVELSFAAGSSISEGPLAAHLVNGLITSGTSKWSQAEIAEKIDSYGAFLERNVGLDTASITVYSLRKYMVEVLEILAEVLEDCTFPEDEFSNSIRVRRQKFLVNREKVATMCRRRFSRELFGNHPYSAETELEDFDRAKVDDVRETYGSRYSAPPLILAAGIVDDELIKTIDRLFGQGQSAQYTVSGLEEVPASDSKRVVEEKKGAVQSALRMGKILFNRNHPDFAEMQFVNTVLGGYFGSRLMSNIREDKGYTYGIGSGIIPLQKGGYFFISTEVGANVTLAAEKEIRFELDRLRQEKVPLHEMETVRQYMLGQLLRSTDGVFNLIDRFRAHHIFGQKDKDFHEGIDKIRAIDADGVLNLAQTHLDPESMVVVVAGDESSL